MRKYIAFLMLCVLSSCIKPFDIEVDEENKKLVVNGLITNEPGPYIVKLNKTTSYGGHFSDIHKDIPGATVTITDDLGVTETLTEVREGEFQTNENGMQGRVGGSYTLKIKLKNGEEYVSETETLFSVPPIERFYFEYKESIVVDGNGNEKQNPVFELRIDTKDPVNERNFYRWISIGTYEVETQPENFTIQDKNGNPMPRPKDCCRQCWVTRPDYSATVTSDKQFNGNTLIGQPVSSIPISPQFLGIKYHVKLKQYSLSEKVYSFWKILENQSAGTGSVQDSAPANAPSNITNVHHPEKQVLGYFGASGVVTKTLYLKKSDVPFPLPKFEFPDDCQVISGSTTTRPSFWE